MFSHSVVYPDLHCSYEGTPQSDGLSEDLIALLNINISVNSSYTSKLLTVSRQVLLCWDFIEV